MKSASFSPVSSSSSIGVVGVYPSVPLVNAQTAEPGVPSSNPALLNICLISGAVRLLLSVTVMISRGTPPGPYPSYSISSIAAAPAPEPLASAFSMLSLGIESFLARSTAARTLAELVSPPAFFTSMVMRAECLENILLRCASVAAFLCFILDHLLCPDMLNEFKLRYTLSHF